MKKDIVGIIPARFASSRLPGKPLAMIGDKFMIRHTYEQAKKSKLLDRVIIATDNRQIYDAVKPFCKDVVMTPDTIQTGSDRIAYVARGLTNAGIIVNIQGDEPFIPPKMIDQAIEPMMYEPDIEVCTLARQIETADELLSPSVVKVVFDNHNFALYFSRATIPHSRDITDAERILYNGYCYKHIGLYVYKKETLFKFTSLEPSYLEEIEKLEQLRLLENGIKIKVVPTEFESLSVDTPEDLKRAEELYKYGKTKRKK